MEERKIDDGGVVGLHSGDGFKEAKLLKGASNGERRKRVVRHQKCGPSEPHAVEARGLYSLRNHIHGLFAEPFRHHKFQMGNPIHTRQLHPSPILAHDPSGIRAKGKARHGPWVNLFHCSSWEKRCRYYYYYWHKENGEAQRPPPSTTYFHRIRDTLHPKHTHLCRFITSQCSFIYSIGKVCVFLTCFFNKPRVFLYRLSSPKAMKNIVFHDPTLV